MRGLLNINSAKNILKYVKIAKFCVFEYNKSEFNLCMSDNFSSEHSHLHCFFKHFYWRIVDLQGCVSFRCIAK